MNNTIIKNENDFQVIPLEKCVICDKETNVPINEHIDFRKNYIEGSGQLCEQCYLSLDNRKYILI